MLIATLILLTLTGAAIFAAPLRCKAWVALAFVVLFALGGTAAAVGALAGILPPAGLSLPTLLFGEESLRMDALSALFTLLVAAGSVAAALYAKGYVDRYLDRKPAAHISLHYFAFTLLSLSMTAVVTASGGYTFLFWWELMTLSSFVLILFDAERKEVLKAALTYLVMMHLGFFALLIGFVAACLDLFVGVTYGAVSALLGGKVDAIMQRIIEILVGIPHLIIVILLMMVLPAGVGTIIVALAITGWVNMARLVRARILQLKNQEFVMAAEVLGTSQKNIILRHLIPNTVGIIVINAMFTIPSAIFTEAFLSFIGIGLSEPQASLGVLINNGYSVLQSYPYLLICPAIVIILIMVCFSILGDGLRGGLDPRMSK